MRTVKRAIVVATAIGIVVSAGTWVSEQQRLAGGESPASIGFGQSHGLFLIGFPWSLLVWAAMIGVGTLFNLNGAEFARPFFYAKPIVAGSGWGLVVGAILDRRQRRRAVGAAAHEADPR